MSAEIRTEPRRLSIAAVLTLLVGIAALVGASESGWVGGAAGVAAILIGLRSRMQLQSDEQLVGAQLSLLGFACGVVAVVSSAMNLLPMLYMALRGIAA